MSFVRGNNLIISGRFWSRANVQPTSAACTLRFCNPQGQPQTATVNLSETDNCWSGSWDSSVAGPGRVEWVVQSAGALLAAAEGVFYIDANEANGAPPPFWRSEDQEWRG